MSEMSSSGPAPQAVLIAIDEYAAHLGDYFSQHNIPFTITCDVSAAVSVDSQLWEAGAQSEQTMFVGSAVKTFMLAEYLRSDLSETAVMGIDDGIRSISSTVFGDQSLAGEPAPDLKLDGETLARSVLEAMISHSDNTATDAILAAVGADSVRDLIGDVGLTSVSIPDSTRRLFTYLASGQGVDVDWETLKEYVANPPDAQAAINGVQSMLASASDMVRWYETALLDPSFFSPADLAEFKRISSTADALHVVVPDNIASYGKGGSITWNDFSCISVSGQMVVPTMDPGRPWVPVTFSFNVNWGNDEPATFRDVAGIFAPAVKGVLTASLESFYWTTTNFPLTVAIDDLTGTAGRDDFSGPGGGLDNLRGMEGDDSFHIQASQTGIISGGGGYDTVHAVDGRLDGGLAFDTVEALNVPQTSVHATVAQLAQFSGIFATAGGPEFRVVLQGAGGELDFSTRFVSTVLLNVDASAVTSAVTLIGTVHDDSLTGSSFDDSLKGGDGNDWISGGGGADEITFGAGHSILHDILTDLNGDTITGLGTKNAISIAGSLVGREHIAVAVGTDKATLSVGDTSVDIDGDFSGGDFMAVARGGAEDATTVSFVKYLPTLSEGVRVNTASINGVANEPFLFGDGSVGFTLQLESATSAFHNALGYYKVAADGTIRDAHIVFADTLDVGGGDTSVDLGTPANGESIGFFLIQNGFSLCGSLPDDLSFVASDGSGLADLDVGQAPLLSSASRGLLTAAPIFHSIADFNAEGAVQVLSGTGPGGFDLRIGFEDLQTDRGDNDFQDVVVSIHTNADGLFIL